MMRSAAKPREGAALVQGHVVGLVAPDGVLGLVRARMVEIALVAHVARVNLDDPPLHAAGLGVPADVITHLEARRHDSSCRLTRPLPGAGERPRSPCRSGDRPSPWPRRLLAGTRRWPLRGGRPARGRGRARDAPPSSRA